MLLISVTQTSDLGIEVLLFYLVTGYYVNLPWQSLCLHRQKLGSISRDTLESIEVQSHGPGLSSENRSRWPRDVHPRVRTPTSCLPSGIAPLSHVTLTQETTCCTASLSTDTHRCSRHISICLNTNIHHPSRSP